MSNSNSLPPIQTFAESRQLNNIANFLAFSDSIVSIARGYGLEGYIDGTITRPTASAPAVMAAGAVPGQPLKCYAPGGDKEGQAPPNWRPPAHMVAAAANSSASSSSAPPAALSTVVDMGCDVGGMTLFHALATKVDTASFRYSRETSPVLKDSMSESINGNVIPYQYQSVLAISNENRLSSPTFLDSAASECCIRDRHMFTSFTPKQAHGRMATNGEAGKFAIKGYGIIQIHVKNSDGSSRVLRMAALLRGILGERKSKR
ncbi:hypothetical protein C8R42DRAFT_644483 [Lentinula raphanica]|nr:hypothetical protein C8R42DRAFT_644483 [Lentinula raphanica]